MGGSGVGGCLASSSSSTCSMSAGRSGNRFAGARAASALSISGFSICCRSSWVVMASCVFLGRLGCGLGDGVSKGKMGDEVVGGTDGCEAGVEGGKI